jgi:hypothetical protein
MEFNNWLIENHPEIVDESYCKDRYDEAFLDSMTKRFKANYNQAQQGVDQNYEKYSGVAKQALAKAGDTAKMLSQKTGVPLPLATALIAAGITGGPTAIPFAALLYFVKQPLMKGANKAFDASWDTGARAVQGVRNAVSRNQPQPQAQLQPESFRAFIEADSWGDWAGEKLGGAAGTVAGNLAGYGGKIASSIGSRIKEIGQYAKNNPKEVARMAFLVGAGAAIGAGVGKLTHDVQDLIVQKIKDYGVPQEELNWLRQNIVIDKSGDEYGPRGEVALQTGNKDTYAAHNAVAEKDGAMVASQDVVSNDRLAFDGATSRSDAGGYGYIAASVKPGEFTNRAASGVAHQDLGDAYRDMAVAMRGAPSGGEQASTLGGWYKHLTGGGKAPDDSFMKNLRGLNPNPQDSIDQFGHSAAAEIKKRLASPDTYTNPAAIAGGVVGGTGNRRRS